MPRPDSGSLRIWLGTGGNPESPVRAGLLGLPITYAIIGGDAARLRRRPTPTLETEMARIT